MGTMSSNSDELNISGDLMNISVSRKPNLAIPKETPGGGDMSDDTSTLKLLEPESGSLKGPCWNIMT